MDHGKVIGPAGVIDSDVDSPELRDRFINEPIHFFSNADVCRDIGTISLRVQFTCSLVARRIATIDDDLSPLFEERLGYAFADPRSAAGNNGDSSAELHRIPLQVLPHWSVMVQTDRTPSEMKNEISHESSDALQIKSSKGPDH